MDFNSFSPLLAGTQFKELDEASCRAQGISTLELMERAAGRAVAKLLAIYPQQRRWAVLCGNGNNGGDGLVMARLLTERGHRVRCFRNLTGKFTPDNDSNFARLSELLAVAPLETYAPAAGEIAIDCLFGAGFSGALAGPLADLVAIMNRGPVVAVDLPSGLATEGPVQGPAVRARHCLCLGALKESLLRADHEAYVGQLHPIDIGLAPTAATSYFLNSPALARQIRWPSAFSHKGSRGKLYGYGGSKHLIGAIALAARAALRGGCGLFMAAVPAEIRESFHQLVPEATSLPLDELPPVQAVLAGPGLGRSAEPLKHLHTLADHYRAVPQIWDADALFQLATDAALREEFSRIENKVISPHPQEFARLAGFLPRDEERPAAALNLARQLRAVVILKGKYTVISDGQNCLINGSGNYGLAKGGSGDVLTGLVGALLAAGYEPLLAAALAVHLHGLSAELSPVHPQSLLASDVIDGLSAAWRYLKDLAREP